METLCNLFLGESHSSSSGCESEGAHYNLDQSPGKAVPRESGVQPLMGAGAWGRVSFILCAYFSYKVSSSLSPGQCHIVHSCTTS